MSNSPPESASTSETAPISQTARAFRPSWAAALITLLLCVAGCPAPQTPFDKASDAVRELNMSARWGKMDVAQKRTTSETLETFQKHHELWHNKIRILDTELIDLKIVDTGHAEAEVEIEWLFEDDTTLRTTRISQRWTGTTGRWLLEKEKRISGSEGLFGEEVERKAKPADTHFPVRVIR
jgi:hypothetical protein